MKPFYFFVLICTLSCVLSLIACSHVDQLGAAADKEGAAWDAADAQAETACAAFIEDGRVAKKKAVAYHECRDKIVRETVIPAALFPELISNFQAKTYRISADYQNGRISREESNARLLDAEASFQEARAAKLNAAANGAAIQDELRRERLAKLGHSLRMESAIRDASRPRSTMCSGSPAGGPGPIMVNCQSW